MEFKKNGPPCAKCKPNAVIGNIDVLNIYPYCNTQLILSADGQPISINLCTVEIAVNRFHCRNKSEVISKIQETVKNKYK